VLWPLILATALHRTTLMEGPLSPPLGSKISANIKLRPVRATQLTVSPTEEGRR
jgi:hypothetical protein